MEQMIITLADGSKVLQTTVDNFPEWAICYCYYGADSAGDLTAEEMQLVDEFTAELGGIVDSDEDYSFDESPAFGLPCRTCSVSFWTTLNN